MSDLNHSPTSPHFIKQQPDAPKESPVEPWKHLVRRAHPWRKQLYVRGRNAAVGQIHVMILANKMTVEQASANFDLPLEAIEEIITYAEQNRDLIVADLVEERRLVSEKDAPMSLRLYLDDCINAHDLKHALLSTGHEVVLPVDVGLAGEDDDVHFAYACRNQLIVMTFNHDDFEELGNKTSDHPGLFIVRLDNDPDRDMTYADMVRAIANIEEANVPISGQLHILNHWRY